eukprot:gene1503-889_t
MMATDEALDGTSGPRPGCVRYLPVAPSSPLLELVVTAGIGTPLFCPIETKEELLTGASRCPAAKDKEDEEQKKKREREREKRTPVRVNYGVDMKVVQRKGRMVNVKMVVTQRSKNETIAMARQKKKLKKKSGGSMDLGWSRGDTLCAATREGEKIITLDACDGGDQRGIYIGGMGGRGAKVEGDGHALLEDVRVCLRLMKEFTLGSVLPSTSSRKYPVTSSSSVRYLYYQALSIYIEKEVESTMPGVRAGALASKVCPDTTLYIIFFVPFFFLIVCGLLHSYVNNSTARSSTTSGSMPESQ